LRDSATAQLPIVVGIDGSEAAIRAAEWAIAEAVSRDVPLRLVAVIPQQAEPAPLESVGNVRLEREYAETALRIASGAVAANTHPVKVETAILRGDNASALIAESRAAAMICVGSVGIGHVARAILGSTAADLAEGAHCPVAIIRSRQHRPKPASPLIVVAVNDSPGNDDVVEWAIKEAQLRHAPVLALGLWRRDVGVTGHDELDRRVRAWLQRYPGVEFHAIATRTGIADYLDASDSRIQLAVIGGVDSDQVTNLVGPHGHPILGHAECSVLVVRAQ
jgi:nucleotide-binding universal stress UspA family protein